MDALSSWSEDSPTHPTSPSIDDPAKTQRNKKAKKRNRETSGDDDHAEKELKKRKKHKDRNTETSKTTDQSLGSTSTEKVTNGEKDKKKKKKTKKEKRKKAVQDVQTVVPSELDLSSIFNDPSAATLPLPVPSLHAYNNILGSGNDVFSQLNNNDDILRAFQDLDLTRLAGVLRSLDLPSSGVEMNTHDEFTALLESTGLLDDQQSIVETSCPPKKTNRKAGSSRSKSSKQTTTPISVEPASSNRHTILDSNNVLAGPSNSNPHHAQLLASKWMGSAKLKELVETEGLVYKKGKFSTIEEQALKTAIENYRVSHGLTQQEITEVVFSKTKEIHNDFWSEITASVPLRPIVAVYHHVHRVYHPLKLQGKWTEAEDSELIRAVTSLGQAWSKISENVGRSAQDCRDRWRNHLSNRRWSKEEEEELTRIVLELTRDQGKDLDNDVLWTAVSDRMGNKRGRQQCRVKWTDSLSKTVKGGSLNSRWRKQDAAILVRKVASMNVRDDSEIDWKLVPDQHWNLWSAHTLQRRWRTLKHAIKGHEEMAFQDIVEILLQKNEKPPMSQVSQTTLGKPPRKGPKSAAVIEEDGDETSNNEVDSGAKV